MEEKEGEEKMYREEECYIPLTIERKLKAYSECREHIERHEILWHEWNHNKRWLIQVQQMILPSFPSYSRHDVSHSEAVLHNIEMILGEDNIRNLSATDCFVLLHTVYIHDIGMCITHEEKKKILENGKFHEYLERLVECGNSDLSYYADILLSESFCSGDKEKKKNVLNKKLEVYYAITYLIAEFRRKEHGEIAHDRLLEWIDKPDKLGVGFSTIELPNRLFYIIANCAATHTKWDFKEVLKLKQEDTGFVLDYVHPRFIAVLLQLGDALDMDNDRFHPLTKEYLGKIPEMSELHYGKHKSIRRLRITNQKISISANCQTQDELRLVRSECDGIKEILKNATFYWSVIKPKESNLCLPTLDRTELLLQGKEIEIDLVKAQFEISQEKAFNLLKGNNIYTEENFVFLRELLQNAVDATKIQYFRECKRRIKRNSINEKKQEEKEKEEIFFSNPIRIKEIISPSEYPVDVELCMKKSKGNVYEDITQDDLKNPEKYLADYKCGVLVKIIDYATGINSEDLQQIANVGSSYETKKEEIKKMPTWLQPTGKFGIGLQSVFLSAKVLKATTHSIKGEPYEIIFHPRQEGEAGYINVMPRDVDKNTEQFGSCFEVFVPHSKKKLHRDSPETWDGTDPFEADYEKTKQIRHTRELLKQMALYLEELVGEALFPIRLVIKDCEDKDPKELYNEEFLKKFGNVSLTIYTAWPEKIDQKEVRNSSSNVTWAYNLDESTDFFEDSNGDIYRLDCDHAKLNIWNQKHNAYACIGIKRILDIREKSNSQEDVDPDEGVKIYYKGIKVTQTGFREDANLIEYIDLKKTLDEKYLKLNRKGFSEEGYEYLEKVYRDIVKTARNALKYFASHTDSEGNYYPNKIIDVIKGLAEKGDSEKMEEVALSATALVYFAMVNETKVVVGDVPEKKENGWNSMLNNLIEIVKTYDPQYLKNSTLYHIPLWSNDGGVFKSQMEIQIYDIISYDKKYAVISIRDNKSRTWMQYLVECNEFHQRVKKMISELRNTTDLEERERLIKEIDAEAMNYLKKNVKDDLRSYLERQKQQIILKWILSNIPSMAIFASEDGNIRMNLLDVDICDSIYFSETMKVLTFHRIAEKKDKAKRFYVPVWSGYEYLSLKKERQSILFVKRGKIPKIGYGKMIFPLTGTELKELMDSLHSPLEEKIVNLYDIVITKMSAKILKDNDEVHSRYFRLLQNIYEEKKKKKTSGRLKDPIEVMKKGVEENKNSLEEADYELIKKKLQGESNEEADRIWNEKLTPMVCQMVVLWNQYEEECRNMKSEWGKKAYDKYCKSKIAYKNLKQYTEKNAKRSSSQKQIDFLYERYIYEIQNILISVCSLSNLFFGFVRQRPLPNVPMGLYNIIYNDIMLRFFV